MHYRLKANTAGWLIAALVLAACVAVVFARWQDTALQHTDAPRAINEPPFTTVTLPAPTSETVIDHTRPAENRQGDARAPTAELNTPESLLVALYSIVPEQRLHALDTIGQAAEMYYTQDNILRRIDELAADTDPRIAELVPLVLAEMMTLRGAQEILMDPNQDAYPSVMASPQDVAPDQAEPDSTSSIAELNHGAGAEREYFVQLSERGLQNSDAAIRLQAIEEAQTQRDERSVALLAQATQDIHPENRLAAVEGLRQILAENFGDTEQISSVLQQSSHDPDPKVAEAARLAIP